MVCQTAGPRVKIGEVEAGTVYEQPVLLDTKSGEPLTIRRIELHLKSATRGKDKIIAVLTNLPAAGPRGFNGKKSHSSTATAGRSRARFRNGRKTLTVKSKP